MKPIGLLILLALLCSAADVPRIRVHFEFLPAQELTFGELLVVSQTNGLQSSGWQNGCVYQIPAPTGPADLFFYQGIGTDTLYVGSVVGSETVMQLQFPLQLRKNLLGHYICPKCRRADATVEIVGSLAPLVRAISTSTGTSYSAIIGRKKYRGCINHGGRVYCQRDKIQF